MEKLKMHHIAPYLPFKLKMIFLKSGRIIELLGIAEDEQDFLLTSTGVDQYYHTRFWDYKPLLRPLSDLVKEHEGSTFLELLYEVAPFSENLEYLCEWNKDLTSTNIEFKIVQKLFEWHFDVFGLIDLGLAFNKNNLE